jgi:hypothetical protein
VICAEMHDWLLRGCTAAFESATQGRRKLEKDGEKVVSVLA